MIINRPNGEPAVKIPNGKGYGFFYNNSSDYQNLTTIVDITGSGFLKCAFVQNQGSATAAAQIKIEIDGVVILNLNFTSSLLGAKGFLGLTSTIYPSNGAGYSGLPLSPALTSDIGTALYVVRSYVFNSPDVQNALDSYGPLFFIPELLRFEDSLKISVIKRSSVSALAIAEWYLDD